MQIFRRGLAVGIEPAAGESRVVGAPDVGGQGISDDQSVFSGDPGHPAAYIVIIGGVWLGGACFLRNESVGEHIAEGTGFQTAPLDRGHCVGNDVQLVAPPGQLPADLLCMGEGKDRLAQSRQIIPVALGGIPVQVQDFQKTDVPLQRYELLCDFTPVKSRP